MGASMAPMHVPPLDQIFHVQPKLGSLCLNEEADILDYAGREL
jgi:hypothetical protein